MSPDWKVMRRLVGRTFVADTDWVLAGIEQAIRTRSNFQLEHRIVRADGSPGWAISRAVPLKDASGAITEWFGAATDVTARKQVEEAVLRSERLASLGRMALTIAHEINNPLEALGNLLFLASHTEGLPASAREFLEHADAELRRVAHITRQSLGFYRESAAPDAVRVDTLIESTIDLLRAKIRSKNVAVETQWRTRQELNAVAGELRQAISNLLANSIDAVEDNGVIKIRTSACTDTNGQRWIRITVADNGKGIDAAARGHIFEPLYTTKDAIGTGLGLWVTKQIVDKHHGRIQLRTCRDGVRAGSTFSMILPV
jgi:signal transduction histidine kinase